MNKKGKKIVNEVLNKGPKLVTNDTYRKDFSGAGKGDAPRPVDKKKFDENYDAIFRKEEGEECCQKCKPKDNE